MKTAEEIYQALAEEFRGRTGLSAAGNADLAARFYAVAAQLYGLYAQADWTRRQCFPQSAQGDALDSHAQLRGLVRRQPVKAAGTVRFFAAGDRAVPAEIPAGTVCMTAEGVRFFTTEEAVVAVEESQADVAVEAAEAGTAGNVGPGTVLYLAVAPVGVTACTNPAAMTGGQDGEDDEALRERVLATCRRLPNGANSAFYQQAALALDGVAAVKVLPRNRGVGTVDVVVTAPEGMPDDSLITRVQDYFDGVREIAVSVKALKPTAKTVDVAISLTAAEGQEFSALSQRVKAAAAGWFTGDKLGRPVLQAELTALVFALEGVANCAVTIDGGDTVGEGSTLPVLGTCTVTQAEN